MARERNRLEPLAPEAAKELFLEHKAADCAEATVRNHKYRLRPLVEWCQEEGIDNLNDLTGRDIQQFRLWRKEDADLNTTTMRNHLCSVRVFLKWAASVEAVPENLYDKILLPQVPRGERQRDEMLNSDTASEILDYLARYHFASVEHAALALLWETGIRTGSAFSLDIDDVDNEDETLRIRHRPEKGTQLKNGKGGERLVALTPELAQLLGEYIEHSRHDVTDEYGRDPLLTTTKGRMSKGTLRILVYRVTAPCFRGEPCPDCHGDSERKCPEAVSPHAIRRGSITHWLSEDVPVEIVGGRMDVSRDVLDEHYDQRSEEVKLEQRRGYLDEV